MKNVTYIVICAIFFNSCGGCSKSGRMHRNGENNNTSEVHNSSNRKRQFEGVTKVVMKKDNGVYKIPVTINGSEMDFIFDTGASIISMSNLEASFLYKQGKLSKEDFIGNSNFVDATGQVSVGAIINLKEVTIGNRTLYNIEASVVDNSSAPLLCGQTALAKFGKISIDYNDETITFE